jgi:hypothetical protein
LNVRVPSANLPDSQNPLPLLSRGGSFLQPQNAVRANWANQFELLGYSVEAADAARRNLQVGLFFHALNPIERDYTFSVKVRDNQAYVWGQEDKWAGSNSYATSQCFVGNDARGRIGRKLDFHQ